MLGMAMSKLVAENILKVGCEGIGKLFWSGRVGAISILKIGNCVLSGSFDDREVEERGVAITVDGLILLGTLEMKFFVFGKELMVLVGELGLKTEVLLTWWFGLLLEKLIFHHG